MDHRRPFFTILYHLSTIKGYICDISQTTSTIRASLEPLVVVQRNCLAFFVYLLLCPGRVASNCRYNQPSSEVLANDPGTSWQSLIAWPPSVIAQCIPIVGILSVKSWTLGRFTKRKFWNFEKWPISYCYMDQYKDMLENKFCSNIAPSASTGLYNVNYNGRFPKKWFPAITFDWSVPRR